ncbi:MULTISPECIES: GNAT family N-acetyltransferase [unclassified Desulfovibrio]|uniref:GNAT family N-acetyltransferase n=1 Tax=unclassified Desulfovibrio TaxID=2593640 RepID=UPI0013EDF1FA|nr:MULTISPECIES: GNAT family N-acetyltransferase [unclassified Desulfovibrio]
MIIRIHHPAPAYDSYRAACVQSLFNADGIGFDLEADLPIDTPEAAPWQIGLVVGPSGSGKSSIGARIWGKDALRGAERWPSDVPIIDAIAPESAGGSWQQATAALSAVGLGDVPAWLRPFRVLSTGQKFRASLARLICEAPARAVVDEFTSVVDRQTAKIGASAFAKAWRATGAQVVLLSCHYDIVDWLCPDWIFDTAGAGFRWTRGRLRRPAVELEICQTGWNFWPLFEPHHYLRPPHMVAATCYVAFTGGVPVAHLAVSTRQGGIEARAARLVVLPDWQGIGIGTAFLNEVCRMWRTGENRFGKPMPTLFNTSHPGLCRALRRSPLWTQVSALLHGSNKARSARSITNSRTRSGSIATLGKGWGYGGHFRAIQGFRYLGEKQEV